MKLINGDCVEGMREMESCSVSAVVTDPPYELGFMGKKWDGSGIAYSGAMWSECLRVLKPGGYLLAFGGTRTYHRMACAIEDAGFEVRDSIHWVYGSGFPKSLNLKREWSGWGTALKPAHEPIVVARKPLIGTVAANVQAHGAGALNIDGCRVSYANDLPDPATNPLYRKQAGYKNVYGADAQSSSFSIKDGSGERNPNTLGRWPPNILLSHTPECDETCAEDCAVAEMDRQSGGASRFFPVFKYQAKASRKEREAGLDHLPEKSVSSMSGRREADRMGDFKTDNDVTGRFVKQARNSHPTVKPVALMEWLIKLVTPPGGVVLDPFAGSGTTGVAATRLGFDFIGIEKDAQYFEICKARIEQANE